MKSFVFIGRAFLMSVAVLIFSSQSYAATKIIAMDTNGVERDTFSAGEMTYFRATDLSSYWDWGWDMGDNYCHVTVKDKGNGYLDILDTANTGCPSLIYDQVSGAYTQAGKYNVTFYYLFRTMRLDGSWYDELYSTSKLITITPAVTPPPTASITKVLPVIISFILN